MQISEVSLQRFPLAIDPALEVVVNYEYSDGVEAPLFASASILNVQKSVEIALATSDISSLPNTYVSARENSTRQTASIRRACIKLRTGLSSRQIDFIESERHKNTKRDILLSIRLHFLVAVSKARLPAISTKETTTRSPTLPPSNELSYSHSGSLEGRRLHSDLWLISGDDSPAFMEFSARSFDVHYTIKSSDWIHDFSNPWGNSQRIIIEVPKPANPKQTELAKWIDETASLLASAQTFMDLGEWHTAIQKMRPAIEHIRSHQNEIEAILSRDGLPGEAIKNLTTAIDSTFQYTSKFIHTSTKSGESSLLIRASREDAQFALTHIAGLLHVIASKSARSSESDA